MQRFILAALALTFVGAALAEAPKVPIKAGDEGAVYVSPNVSSTETSVQTKGATIGAERPDGSSVYGGVDTSTPKPTYSAGASTGGDVSFSAGATSDGKNNVGMKAGVKIKY